MTTRPLAALSLLAALAAPLPAPLPAQDRGPVVGVGITMPDFGLLLPINVSAHFRLEPYVMFYSARADYPASSDTAWASHTRVGLGVFSVTHPGETVSVYFGPRLGLLWGSTKVDGASTGQASTTGNGWFLGGAIGAEYHPVPHIALGGEALMEYEHTSPSPSTALTMPGTTFARAWFSSGSLVVRFYP